MALVFKSPKTAINTTTRDIQNIKDGECPPCPECPEVELTTAEVEYTENGSFTVTPESGFDGLSQVDITVNIDTQSIADEAYAEGEAAGIVTGKAQGVAEQKAKLTSTTLTTNGTVTREDGWNEVTVNVDTTTPYNEGVAAGIAEQKAKLTSLNVTSNGTYNKEDGYNAVTVDVQPELEAKTVSYASNGEYTITPTTGKDGISEATITVDVPSDVNNQDKTVTPTTSSQSVTADSGYSGLGTVTVEAVTSSIDANIAAGNIKNGVTILGVTGTVTEGITPTGNINITNTNSTDVTNYATAQVVDANLTAGNIKSGTTILGVEGSYDPQPDLETKSVTYTANDTYTITPTAGKDGMSSVEVTVNVAGGGGTQCPDWSSIGWDCNDVNYIGMIDDVAVTASLLENYTPSYDSNPFANTDIVYAPKVSPTSGGNPDNSIVGWFQNCKKLQYIPPIKFTSGIVPYFVNCVATSMFENCTSLKKISIDLKDYGNGSYNNGYVTGALSMFSGCTSLTDVTLSNTEGLVNINNMFNNCTSLITAPEFNTSSATKANNMFMGCTSLTTIPVYDFSNVTQINNMFDRCLALKKIPALNTSNVTSAANLFGNGWITLALEEIAQLNFSKVTNINSMFTNYMTLNNFTTLGGFLNLGKAFASTDVAANHLLELHKATKLTKESIMNIINNLAAPDDTAVTDATLKLSAASYRLLTEEDIAIATAKNWTVVSA